MTKKTLTISVDEEEIKKFKIFCLNKDMSVSEAIRKMMQMARLHGDIKYIEDK